MKKNSHSASNRGVGKNILWLQIVSLPLLVVGHGYMSSPRSRNWVAAVDGVDIPKLGVPAKEYCPHCLSANDGVCGKTSSGETSYDENLDSTGKPMAWNSQEIYVEGDTITVETHLVTNHYGHMEIRACPHGSSSTQACFDTPGSELIFIDETPSGNIAMPPDLNYPERGYYSPEIGHTFIKRFQLPAGVYGDEVMLQYKYITANSCNPAGYEDYFNNPDYAIPSDYWMSNLDQCSYPLRNDGDVSCDGCPQQFFNCAEVTIIPNWRATPAPTPAPVTEAPVEQPSANDAPVAPPTDAPIAPAPASPAPIVPNPNPAGELFRTDQALDAWESFLHLDSLTYEVQSDPPIYSLQSTRGAGASGDVTSQSQSQGLLITSIVLASWEEHAKLNGDADWDTAVDAFEGYFNGWKQMCSHSSAACQSTKYCDGGTTACLPGWKHTGDLSMETGSGSSPNADEDAIVAMIFAIKAFEAKEVLPSFYDELNDWAERSCTAFLYSDTVANDPVFDNHRLLKLGSCRGGWENNGNNPSYHSPGSYKVMRDFHAAYGNRAYSLPISIGNVNDAWNDLIEASNAFLAVASCPEQGMVPNWATVTVDSGDIVLDSFSFTGSGTPQWEYGSEAAAATWRVAFDAALYPDEMDLFAKPYLNPLLGSLEGGFNTAESSAYDFSTLTECAVTTTPGIIAVSSAWRDDYGILAPTVSSLVVPYDDIPESEQQTMIDVTGSVLANNIPTASNSLLWTLLGILTLNGAIESTGTLLQPWSAPVSTAPVAPLTEAPTGAPTAAPTEAPTEAPTAAPTAAPTSAPVTPVTEYTELFQDDFEEGFDSFLPDIVANGMDSTLQVKSGSHSVKLIGTQLIKSASWINVDAYNNIHIEFQAFPILRANAAGVILQTRIQGRRWTDLRSWTIGEGVLRSKRWNDLSEVMDTSRVKNMKIRIKVVTEYTTDKLFLDDIAVKGISSG